MSHAAGGGQVRFGSPFNVRFRRPSSRNQTNAFREGFRMPLGVRKCPENESLVLRAGAMGISAEGLVGCGCLGRG
ncbi:MAG: hypothetical protein ACK5VS_04285, partial [Hyphomonadaceae bacterium]